jgi:hypothetical protein
VHRALVDLPAVPGLPAPVEGLAGDLVGRRGGSNVAGVVEREEPIVAPLTSQLFVVSISVLDSDVIIGLPAGSVVRKFERP